MDESSSDVSLDTKNRNLAVWTFAWVMLMMAITMGILYATKKCLKCSPDDECWKRLRKLENLIEVMQNCENQNWEENQSNR
jgi:hypothetical protein